MNNAEFSFGDAEFLEGPLFIDDSFAEIGDEAELYLAGMALTQELLSMEVRTHLAVTAVQVAGAVARENIQAIVRAGETYDPASQIDSEAFADFVEVHSGAGEAHHLRWQDAAVEDN